MVMAPVHTSGYEIPTAGAASASSDAVRERVLALRAEGKQEEAFEFVIAALEAVLRKSRELELVLARLRRAGRSSERMDPEQLALLLEQLADELGRDRAGPDPRLEARADAELEREIEQAEQSRPQRERGPRSDWRTRGVRHEVHVVEIAAEERTCQRCGQGKQKIGSDVSRVLEYVPGHFVEHEYQREKWACGRCKRGVSTAPAPPRVIGRSAADASLLAHVVVSKYVDHVPLHRLHRIYGREGAIVPVSTLSDWVAGVADRLTRLVDRIAARILRDAYVVGTDATGLPVLDADSPEHIQRGTMWVYVGDGRDVVFHYTPTGEGATGPWRFLAGRNGCIQADAASVFDRLFNGHAASAIEVGCWAHARRKFIELRDTDCRAAYPIKLIGRLYRIEHLADLRELDAAGRLALRRERSLPVLDALNRALVATLANEPPRSEFARAAGYAVNQWKALTRFTDDGRLGLDNNLVERQLRDIALGRKNYLFAASHRAARRTATLYSVLRTCAQHGVPQLPYLTDVLQKLAGGPDSRRFDALLPDRWIPHALPP